MPSATAPRPHAPGRRAPARRGAASPPLDTTPQMTLLMYDLIIETLRPFAELESLGLGPFRAGAGCINPFD